MNDGLALESEHGAVRELLELRGPAEPYSRTHAELLPVQLRALDERFSQRRGQIKVLDQRAKDVNVAGIESLADVVPLLFAHMTYKSYPESFMQKGQWDRMNMWLETLGTAPVAGVDLNGVDDVDEWLVRLEAAGHHVRASSGTSGKASFLDWTEVDRTRHREYGIDVLIQSTGLPADRSHPTFLLGPVEGFNRFVDGNLVNIAAYGRPDAIYPLLTERTSIAEVNRLGAVRKAMRDGTVSPEDLEALQRSAAAQDEAMEARFDFLVQKILEHRGEHCYVRGGWSQLYRLMVAARRAGVADGELLPGSTVVTGGGKKAANYEGDWQEETVRFFEGSRFVNNFGMSEINLPFPQCSEQRFHIPAQVVPILLDDSGEGLAEIDGPDVTGRLGVFDFSLDARWGGVITSDAVDMHFGPCPCGLASTSIGNVNRFGSAGGGTDDKLTCAGTIEAYVRGIVAPDL